MPEPRRDQPRSPSPRDPRSARDGRGAGRFDLPDRRDPRQQQQTGGGPPRGHDPRPAPPREPAPVSAAVQRAGVPHGATEAGWLPDCVYTGDKFESGLAFFADAQGRITRFSREPADLAQARRLEGQAALPGLVNTHSHALARLVRGRAERRGADVAALTAQAWAQLGGEDVFDAARMVFLEMLLSGTTCVGEFHALHHQPDGSPYPDPNHLAREIIRAAHDTGIRIALLKVAQLRGDFGAAGGEAPARRRHAAADAYVRDLEALRAGIEKDYAADEVWLGAATPGLGAVPLEAFKAIAHYARAQRLRLHTRVAASAAEVAACTAEYGRPPVALLAEHGVVDKRFIAVEARHLNDDEVKLLGAARAAVCVCPAAERSAGLGAAPVEKLLAAGAGLAFGTEGNAQVDLLREARELELGLRAAKGARAGLAGDAAQVLLQAATAGGARSLGATGGALEVGRPADFFTVNLFDPALAGADAGSLAAHILHGLERRAIRDVWIGARQRVANGRHVAHGAIIGRFVDLQKRVWAQG